MASRCRHDDHVMVAYVPLATGKAWFSTLWCPACGALGTRRYDKREAVTEWKLPQKRQR